MYKNILIFFLILFITFCIISKKEFFKSFFYTIFFIITLWINIPCFENMWNFEGNGSKLVTLPINLYNECGILYVLIANILLCGALYLQSRLSNKHTYTHYEVKRKYDDFGDNAVELYIIGRDLDFLDKKEYKTQTDRIIHLKHRCKLLCELTEDKKLLDLYKKMYQQGVEIRFYTQNDNITNLKGQIKIDQKGNKKAIFMTRENKKYSLLIVENQFLITSILDGYNEVYKNSNALGL